MHSIAAPSTSSLLFSTFTRFIKCSLFCFLPFGFFSSFDNDLVSWFTSMLENIFQIFSFLYGKIACFHITEIKRTMHNSKYVVKWIHRLWASKYNTNVLGFFKGSYNAKKALDGWWLTRCNWVMIKERCVMSAFLHLTIIIKRILCSLQQLKYPNCHVKMSASKFHPPANVD